MNASSCHVPLDAELLFLNQPGSYPEPTGRVEPVETHMSWVFLTDDYAYQFNLDTKRGAYIVPSQPGEPSIVSGSPADKAGLQEKDIITRVNDDEVNEKNSLISLLGRHSVGDKVTLTIIRDSNEQKVDVTLEAAPQN